MQKGTNQDRVLTDEREAVTGSFGKEFICPVKRTQKRKHRAWYGGVEQPSVKMVSSIPRNVKPVRRGEYIVSFSSNTDLFEDVQRDLLRFSCTADALYKLEALLDWSLNARSPTDFCVLRFANRNLFTSAFLQSAMIPA